MYGNAIGTVKFGISRGWCEIWELEMGFQAGWNMDPHPTHLHIPPR
jgi:hypothetical protein